MNSATTKPLSAFDTQASTVECDLSGDDLIALGGNTAWRVLWWERRGVSGWRVKAERIGSRPLRQRELRLPYRDD